MKIELNYSTKVEIEKITKSYVTVSLYILVNNNIVTQATRDVYEGDELTLADFLQVTTNDRLLELFNVNLINNFNKKPTKPTIEVL